VVHAELAEDIVCSGLTVTIVGTSQLGSLRGNRRKAARRQKRIQTSFRRAMTLLPSLPNLLARKLGRPDDHTVMRARVHELNSVQPGDRTDHRSTPNRAPKAGKSLTVL
jgi:hypothetical protein